MSQAIGYARVSTEGQAAGGVSLDAQRARIEAWCTFNGRKLDRLLVDAISGKRADNRPELQKALDAVCQRPKRGTRAKDALSASGSSSGSPIGSPSGRPVLIVYSLSRLARSTQDAIQIANRLGKAGADLVSLTEQIDTTSPMGRFTFVIMAGLAQLEREMIGERTSTALQHMRSLNQRVGGVPFGWDLEADGVMLHEIPAEQTVIRQIIALRDSGLSLRAIAERLMAQRVPAKQGRRWHPKPINAILRRVAADAGRKPAAAGDLGTTAES